MIKFEPQYLPGHSPADIARRARKRKCRYAKGTKQKKRWRIALRKWKRKQKRKKRKLKKLVKDPKSKTSTNPKSQERKMKKKLKKKRKKIRKKKIQMRRHRIKRHLMASKTWKKMVKSRGKMTKKQILERLGELKEMRRDIMYKHQRYRALVSKPKRKAIRHLKFAWKRARHQRKKYQRYRRMLQRTAKKRNLGPEWRKKYVKKKPKTTRVLFEKKPGKVAPTKRVEYQRVNDIKVTINAVELPNDEKHIAGKEKVLLDSLPICCKDDVVGKFGLMKIKILQLYNDSLILFDLRWQVQLTDDKTGSKEAKILSKMAMIGSENTMRVIQYGQYLNLQYVITPATGQVLSDILAKYDDKLTKKIPACVHIIHQTFLCVKDLHKVGYYHLRIDPSAFSIKSTDTATFVFNNFQFALTREEIKGKSPWISEEGMIKDPKKIRLPKNEIHAYSSRAQHFRLVRGAPDDYESWFYVCAKILNKKALPWEEEKNHFTMAMAKYKFAKDYSHPDELTNFKMKTLQKYCLSTNERNGLKVGFFVERILQDWKERKPIKLLPWQDLGKENEKKQEQNDWMKANKKWAREKPKRTCQY